MKQKEFNLLVQLKKELNEAVKLLWTYIKVNYEDCLNFDCDSNFHHYNYNDELIWIEYYDKGYDCYDSNVIDIPVEDFFYNPTKWADRWAKKIREEKKKEKEKEKNQEEERERAELKRLKEKYE